MSSGYVTLSELLDDLKNHKYPIFICKHFCPTGVRYYVFVRGRGVTRSSWKSWLFLKLKIEQYLEKFDLVNELRYM